MKRCRIGAGLLLLLLVLGLVTAGATSRFFGDLADQITQAALTGDPEAAAGLLAAASENWNRRRFFTAVLSDHDPMNEADTLFLLLEKDDPENFRENALRLAQLLYQLSQSQLPKLENIL